MGARPSSFRQGGGFLNNVDGMITDYEFTPDFPGSGETAKRKRGKQSEFNSLYFVLSARVDGADEDVTTTLFVGNADMFEISEDGHSLTPIEDGYQLGANSEFAWFITSLVENGFPETNLPEDEINYEAIIGTRVRFVQVVNEEKTKRLGKRRDKKTGKEYDRRDLKVAKVYSLAGKSTGKTASKPAPAASTKTTKSGKSNGAPKDEQDLTERADEVLVTVLGEHDGLLAKSKLPMKITQKLMKDPQREELRKLIYSDEYLIAAEERGLISYDQSDKKQTISLV